MGVREKTLYPELFSRTFRKGGGGGKWGLWGVGGVVVVGGGGWGGGVGVVFNLWGGFRGEKLGGGLCGGKKHRDNLGDFK